MVNQVALEELPPKVQRLFLLGKKSALVGLVEATRLQLESVDRQICLVESKIKESEVQ